MMIAEDPGAGASAMDRAERAAYDSVSTSPIL